MRSFPLFPVSWSHRRWPAASLLLPPAVLSPRPEITPGSCQTSAIALQVICYPHPALAGSTENKHALSREALLFQKGNFLKCFVNTVVVV